MKKVIALVLAAIMVAGMFAGCGSGSSGSSSDSTALKIGGTGPLTGDASAYGIAVKAAMEIAVEEINALGGLQIELQYEDDEADGSDKTISAYNSLKDWGMQIFAGAVTTGSSLAIASEADSDNIFMLTPSASAVEVPTGHDNVFQMCFTDPNQGASAAELISQHWPDATIGVIYDSSDTYSDGIRAGFIEKAAELGLNVVCEVSFTDDNKSDLSSQVTMCRDNGCDVVFMPFYYTQAAQVLTYANTIGYAPTFLGGDGMDGILTVEGFDTSLAEGLALMTPFDATSSDEDVVSFVTKYEEKTGITPNQFAADGYDVIYAIYNACVELGIDGTTSASDACDMLKEYFATYTFDGLTGSGMTWDEEGMVSKDPAAVVVTNGVYVPMD